MKLGWQGSAPGPTGPTGATGATGAAGTHLGSMLAGNATNATVTMAASGLTVPVVSGHRYIFRAVLRFSESLTGDGSKIDFDGSAAATDFRAWVSAEDDTSVLATSGFLTALATDFSVAAHDDIQYVVEGSYEPSANGDLVIRFAQNVASGGTLTLYRGSSLILWEIS